MNQALTVADLHLALSELLRLHPDDAYLPVHLLDVADPNGTSDAPECGLLTTIEVDAFSDVQGRVLSLISAPHEDQPAVL